MNKTEGSHTVSVQA